MCIVKPLRVVSRKEGRAILENGLEAVYDKSSGDIKPGDMVVVYGNYIIRTYSHENKEPHH